MIWRYQAKIDTERAEGTFYNPYNRGLAIAYGKVYIGTTDGRMIALDAKTGKVVWDNMILSVEKGNKGFTGAPLIVKDKVIIGSNGGELSGCCGPIFAVDAQTGEVAWQFDTIGGDERSRASWGNDSLEDRRRRRLDDRFVRSPRPTRSGGVPPIRRPTTTGPVKTGRPKVRVRVKTCTAPRSSFWMPTPVNSSRTSRKCRTTPGTSTAPWANS